MTDEKKFPDLSDLDWDAALDEWERTSFVGQPRPAADAPPHDDDDEAEGTLVTRVPPHMAGAPGAQPVPPPPPKAAPLLPNRPASLPPPRPASIAPARPASAAPPRPASVPPPRPASFAPPRPASVLPPRTEPLTAPALPNVAPPRPPSFAPSRPAPPPPETDVVGFDPLFDPPADTARLDDDSQPTPILGAQNAARDGDESTQVFAGTARRELAPGSVTAQIAAPPVAEDTATDTDFPDDEMPTGITEGVRPRALLLGPPPPVLEGPAPPRRSRIFGESGRTDERPAHAWLSQEEIAETLARASWLEAESRACTEPEDQARGLLVVSELHALAGDFDRAYAFACEARELAPDSTLAFRQARQLMGYDPTALVPALEEEARRSPTPAARAHATLFAADILRTAPGGGDPVPYWDSARKLDPSDVRAPATCAALALGHQDHTSPALNLSETAETASLDQAVCTILRLRGAPRHGVETRGFETNDALRRARAAIEQGDGAAATAALTEITHVPDLARPSQWLAAALAATQISTRRNAVRWLKLLSEGQDAMAAAQLVSRGLELSDRAAVDEGLRRGELPALDQALLRELIGQPADLTSLVEPGPIGAALAAVAAPSSIDRDAALVGAEESRAEIRLARLVVTGSDWEALHEPARANLAVLLEGAVRHKDFAEVYDALTTWKEGGAPDAPDAAPLLVAAVVAERARDATRAEGGYRRAFETARTREVFHRLAAPALSAGDEVASLLEIADATPDPTTAAILRLEAVARMTRLPDPVSEDTVLGLLSAVERDAPALGIASFLAERRARRRGDLEDVVRLLRERRARSADPLEGAIDAVREALLVADATPDAASDLLEEAHRARPSDFALRDLHERMASRPLPDRAAWREARADALEGDARVELFLEAALDAPSADALRLARKALGEGGLGVARVALERAELATGEVARQEEELLARARAVVSGAEGRAARREVLERLAELEDHGRAEPANALPWHRTILDDDPVNLPSLRRLEHDLLGGADDDALETVATAVASVLSQTVPGECVAHAWLAAQLRARSEGGWTVTADLADLAASQPEPPLWALREKNAHARLSQRTEEVLATTHALLERATRPAEAAALSLRASEAHAAMERAAEAIACLERAAAEDPGDVVAWGFLAEARGLGSDPRKAADACEAVARTSAVPAHQIVAWYDAAVLWLDEVKDTERGVAALEAAARIDPTFEDVFKRLSMAYAERKMDAELAALLERRLELVSDPDERVTMEVDRARALAEMGDNKRARAALEAAIRERPDHATALGALGDVAVKEKDWAAAEQAWVRLARLLPSAEEQRAIYTRLGELYLVHAPNLNRAEVAFRKILEHAPGDLPTLEKLVDVYKRQNDSARAVDAQQEILALVKEPEARLTRILELADIHENTGRDLRKAEQALEAARREMPTNVKLLRALAEFYQRQKQLPAMQILLDRAASDARRAFAAGRFVPALFEILATAYELRGKRDAARVVNAALAAIDGRPSKVRGAETRGLDPRLDDLLAPEMVTPGIRALLARAGDALDVASPTDLRALHATPLPAGAPLAAMIGAVAAPMGISTPQLHVSADLKSSCVPVSSSPASLVVGEGLVQTKNELARAFLVIRSLKLVATHASALARVPESELDVLLTAFWKAFNPTWEPEGVDAEALAEAARRLAPGLPDTSDPEIGVLALEAAGTLGVKGGALGPAAVAWANRVALLAVGDPGAAVEGIAWSLGEEGAPSEPEARLAWIGRTVQVRELLAFSVSDTYNEARARLGLASE